MQLIRKNMPRIQFLIGEESGDIFQGLSVGTWLDTDLISDSSHLFVFLLWLVGR